MDVVEATNIPIIGILTQEVPTNYQIYGVTYIAASYVKFVEQAGAKVVPIIAGRSLAYYKKMVNVTNGILLPGGDADLEVSGGYAEAGKMIIKLVMEANEKTYYPLFGICLGMELIAKDLGGISGNCTVFDTPMNLYFTEKALTSRLYGRTPEHIIKYLENEPLTFNYHHICILTKQVESSRSFRILSVNECPCGLEFVSSLEANKYPIYGVQFHPEKNQFEFNEHLRIPHSQHAIMVSQYYANFFVEEARRNSHSFCTVEAERKTLIYNYEPFYTGLKNGYFEQMYFFKD